MNINNKKEHSIECSFLISDFLSSRAASSQVLSTFVSLTSVFGMGTGVSSQLSSLFLNQQLPILPGRFQPSTFGVCELNFCVRHGYRCILTAIATVSFEDIPSKLYRSITEVSSKTVCALCFSLS